MKRKEGFYALALDAVVPDSDVRYQRLMKSDIFRNSIADEEEL